METMHPLRQARRERGWSQYDLAFLSGVPQVFISYAERGYPILKAKHKKKLADLFAMDVDTLFSKEAEKAAMSEIVVPPKLTLSFSSKARSLESYEIDADSEEEEKVLRGIAQKVSSMLPEQNHSRTETPGAKG